LNSSDGKYATPFNHMNRRRALLYLDLIRWSRPAGTYLLLWPTLSALWIAAGGFPGWHLLAVFVLRHLPDAKRGLLR
jgi:4-hydroxybenzoate polyprenyltransferase